MKFDKNNWLIDNFYYCVVHIQYMCLGYMDLQDTTNSYIPGLNYTVHNNNQQH